MNKQKRTKGFIVLEVLVSAIIIGLIAAGLLNVYNIGQQMHRESKESLIAINVLDCLMSYFEDNVASWANTGGNFVNFATPTSTANIVNNVSQGSDLVNQVLSQLKNWQVEYRIDEHSSSKFYKDRVVILRLSWDAARAALRKTEEIFTLVTSRVW